MSIVLVYILDNRGSTFELKLTMEICRNKVSMVELSAYFMWAFLQLLTEARLSSWSRLLLYTNVG